MPPIAAAPAFYGALASGAAAVGTGVMANRAEGGSAKRALQYQTQSDAAAMREAMAQRQEDQRRWEAEQANRQREMAVADEERLFNRKLLEQREARQEPYRQASQQALRSLGALLGFDPAAGQPAPLNSQWLSPSQVGRRPPTPMGDASGVR